VDKETRKSGISIRIMEKPTRKRKTQPKEPKAPGILRIGDRDRDILRLVYEHRFLDTELLWHLIREQGKESEIGTSTDGKARPRKYGFGMKALYKRLRQLSQGKYLKPRQAMPRPIGRGFGGARTAYGLGSKSAQVLSESIGIPVSEVRDIVASDDVGERFIQHALEVARFRVVIELACRESEGNIRLLFWEQGIRLQDLITGEDLDGEERRFSVFPDAFFGLDVVGKGKAHYFLELDRGTMPIVRSGNRSDIRKKVFGYMLYRKAKRHSTRYRYRRLPNGSIVGLEVYSDGRTEDIDASGAEPIKSFRVLFIAPGAPAGELTSGGRIANILSAFPSFGKQFATSTLFWFVSLESFELDRPETAFERIWLTPNPEHGPKSLIE